MFVKDGNRTSYQTGVSLNGRANKMNKLSEWAFDRVVVRMDTLRVICTTVD